MTISNDIAIELNKKLTTKIQNIDHLNDQIILVDAEKQLWDSGIYKLDQELFDRLEKVNQTIVDTQTAYQNRIDSGCYSDLFWKVTGIAGTMVPFTYTLTADQLSLAGYGSSVSYVDSGGGITTYSSDTKFGFDPDNYHKLVYKNQPYLQDIGDTIIASFVGVIGAGSSILTIVSSDSTSIVNSLSSGNLITCSKQGVFSSDYNTIVGFGTTVFTSTQIQSITGIATTSLLTNTIILSSSTIGFSSAPESNGSYVSFTAITDPVAFANIDSKLKYAIPFNANPFSKETIGIVTSGSIGIGYSVKYDNTGNPSNTQSWSPEYAGSTVNGVQVTEPNVGSGRIYYRTGFNVRPVDGGNPVAKGDVLTTTSLSGLYGSTPACSSPITTSLNTAIAVRDAAKLELTNTYGDFQLKLISDNLLREQRNEYSLRIWGMRQIVGSESADIDKYKIVKTQLQSTPIA
jgi:hypothetical protein